MWSNPTQIQPNSNQYNRRPPEFSCNPSEFDKKSTQIQPKPVQINHHLPKFN